MSAMADMSRAIRTTIEAYSLGPKLSDVPTPVLAEFHSIVGAFYLDLKDELEKQREQVPA